ncbi:UNKNOWN [Stylonychia lemnae]|uniref:Uncharacterized protein n=1 Tax=Stylonychia lemnae TaxID=5949 RepID=A0A078AB88_STYLE|nr:UNKNOWN [Stylonychia lemnae]|eukprot:CDW78867.1 UNKNOWN [Stylonychia lemnae]
MQFESSPAVISSPLVQDFFTDVFKIFSSIPIEYYKYSSIVLGSFSLYEGIIQNVLQSVSSSKSSSQPTLDLKHGHKQLDIATKDHLINEVIKNKDKFPLNNQKTKLSMKISLENLLALFYFVYQIFRILEVITPVISIAAAPFALLILFQDHKSIAKSTLYKEFLNGTSICSYILAFLIGSMAIFYPLTIQLLVLILYDQNFDFFTLLDIVFLPIMSKIIMQLLPIAGARTYVKMAKTVSGGIF